MKRRSFLKAIGSAAAAALGAKALAAGVKSEESSPTTPEPVPGDGDVLTFKGNKLQWTPKYNYNYGPEDLDGLVRETCQKLGRQKFKYMAEDIDRHLAFSRALAGK